MEGDADAPIIMAIPSCVSNRKVYMWDTLRKHYERETLASKLFLKRRYF